MAASIAAPRPLHPPQPGSIPDGLLRTNASSPAGSVDGLLVSSDFVASGSTPPRPISRFAEPTFPEPVASAGINMKHRSRLWLQMMPRVLRLGFIRLARRIAIVAAFLILFYLILLLIKAKAKPDVYDYSGLNFNWRVNPREFLRPWNATFGEDYDVLMDAHIHTTESDGQLEPSQVVDWAIAHGYNAIAVTDHNTVRGAVLAREYAERVYPGNITVLIGQEYSCCRIHMNILGVNETIAPTSPWPTDAELKSVVDKAHSLGGIVVVNHIPWSNRTTAPYQLATLPNHPSLATLLDSVGVDGVEIINGQTVDSVSYSDIMARAAKGSGKRVVAVTGSDMHTPDGAYAWTALRTSNGNGRSTPATSDQILASLRTATNTSILFFPAGTRPRAYPPVSVPYNAYVPLGGLAEYFENYVIEYRGMYSYQGSFCQPRIYQVEWGAIGWLVVWLVVICAAGEIVWWGSRKMWLWIAVRATGLWKRWRGREDGWRDASGGAHRGSEYSLYYV